MPKFLENKLRAEYGNNPHAIYGTMNKIGAMHGNKETAKGREMEQKHMADKEKEAPKLREMRIEIHREKSGKVTGHTVHHMHVMTPSKSGAFMGAEEPSTHTFGPRGEAVGEGENGMGHIANHLNWSNDEMANPKPKNSPGEQESEDEQ